MASDKGLIRKTGERRNNSVGRRSFVSFLRLLLRDTRGQVLLFGAVLVVAILAFLLAIPNGTQATTQKVRAQTAADVGAFTGSVWLARALNLDANLNIGIRSTYTWVTVLTMGSALAQALLSDTFDTSVMNKGRGLTLALFNNNDPTYVSGHVYPEAVRKLDATAHWLYDLQDDITASFHDVAALLGTEDACLNAGAYPPSPSAGGWVLVRSNDTTDTTPLLVENPKGDSLMYNDLLQLGAALESIPTNDTNIGPATGRIFIDFDSLEVKAYYGFWSMWGDLYQHIVGKFCVVQWYSPVNEKPTPGSSPPPVESCRFFWENHDPSEYLHYTGFSVTGFLTEWYRTDLRDAGWYAYGRSCYNVPHWNIDTVLHQVHWKWVTDSSWMNDTVPAGKPWLDTGCYIDSSWMETHFFRGRDSTTGYQTARVSPRRVNPDRWFHAVSYVWRLGATTSPRGLGAPMGGSLFPRGSVAPRSPMLTVARSVPYLALTSPTEYEYYFTPGWDVKLTPIDAAGVQDICGDSAYNALSLDSFKLQDIERYVLLP